MSKKEGVQKENKILNILLNVLLTLIIVFAILFSYTAYMTKTGSGVASVFGFSPMSIQSDSMKPTFSKGDLIIVKQVKDVSKLKEGDIITFWTVINGERALNTHRIIGITDNGTYYYFNTKGDNNTISDAIGIHQAELVGQHVTTFAGVGKLIDYLQTSTGFLICIVIPVVLFFIYHLVDFFKALFAYQAEKVRLEYEKELNDKKGE